MSDLEKIKKLRQSTGAGFNDCNEAGKVYHHAMHENSNHYGKLLVEQYDFSKCNLIVCFFLITVMLPVL